MKPVTLTALVCAALVVATADPASASPRSRELIREGSTAMARGEMDIARSRFQQALAADPKDADALVFLAAVSNRTRRPDLGLDYAQRAKAMKSDHPDLDLELGWAQLENEQFVPALASLNRYEAAHPGSGFVSELTARAYLGLGQIERGRAKLQEAATRDPSLKPVVAFRLAQIDAAEGRTDDAAQRLATLAQEQQNSATGRSPFDRAGVEGTPLQKPWSLSVLGGVGYNNNVIAAGNNVGLPSDISGRGSFLMRGAVDAGWTVYTDSIYAVAVHYDFIGEHYTNGTMSAYDLLDHTPRIDGVVRLAPDLTAGLRLAAEITEVGGPKYRDAYTARPSLAWRANSWAVIEGAFDYTRENYQQPPPFASQDRSGQPKTIAVTTYLSPPNPYNITGAVGYAHTFLDARGSEYQGDRDVISLSLAAPLPWWQIRAELAYSHSFDRYDNPSSFAGPVGFAFARSDDIDTIGLQLTKPIWGAVNAFTRYDFTSSSSNINLFDYTQHVVLGGVLANF